MKGEIAILNENFDWKATYHIFNRRKRFDNKRFKKSVDYKFLISQLLLILIKNVTDIILSVMSWVAFIFLSVISHRLHYGHIPVQIQQLRQKSKVSKRSAFFIFDLE